MKTLLLSAVVGLSLSCASVGAFANGAGTTQCPQAATSVFNFQPSASNPKFGTITSAGLFDGRVAQLVSSPLSGYNGVPLPAGMRKDQNGPVPNRADLRLAQAYDGTCQYTYTAAWHDGTPIQLTMHFIPV